jgi:hypothetical protein
VSVTVDTIASAVIQAVRVMSLTSWLRWPPVALSPA